MKKSVLLTGASTGIGRAITVALDNNGYQVFAGIRKREDAESLSRECSSHVVPIILDVTDDSQIAEAYSIVEKKCCQSGLVGIVNNAGIAVPSVLEFVPLEKAQQQFDVNFFGVMRVTQKFLPLIRKYTSNRNGYGRIINMGSIAGRNGFPFLGLYNASKFALAGYSEALRYELTPWNIKVVLLEPGAVSTPIWQKSENVYDEVYNLLPEHGKRLYEKPLQVVQKLFKKAVAKSITPEIIAEAVLESLESPSPKHRILFGTEAKIAALLVRLLPDRLRYKLVVNKIGLTTQQE